MRGGRAVVAWGYQPAAVLRGWTFTGSSESGEFRGAAENLHEFRLSQSGLVLSVPLGTAGAALVWPVLEVAREGAGLVVRVGAKRVQDA